MEDYDDLIGLTVAEAKVARPDDIIRVVARDDQYLAVTADYRMDRINVYIKNDVIIGVKGRG